MIRQLQKEDVDEAARIWLDANLDAHDFISPQYWKDNFKAVKEMLSQGELYVCEDENKEEIQGFVNGATITLQEFLSEAAPGPAASAKC